MRYLVVFVLFACLAVPGFSQESDSQQRFKTLGDSMGRTASNSTSKLEYYDDLILDDGNAKTYTNYTYKYNSLSKALRESEARLDFLIRAHDRNSKIRAERDNYEKLSKQMAEMKSDYDNWLRTVQ